MTSYFENPSIAALHIPGMVAAGFAYRNGDASERYQLLEQLDEATSHRRSVLFYAKLIENPDVWSDYDSFNFIPLGYEEITALAFFANEFNTQLTGKIELLPNSLKVRVIS